MRFRLIGLLVLAGLLAACGGSGGAGGGGNGGGGTPPAPTVDPEKTAQVLGNAYTELQALTQPLSPVGLPVPMIPILQAGVAPLSSWSWNCQQTTISGNTTDADGDGIPVDATYSGGCSFTFQPDSGGSVSGSWRFKDLRIVDPDDRDPEAGYRISGEIDWSLTVSGTTHRITWHLRHHDFEKSTPGTWTFRYQGRVDSSENVWMEYNLSGTWEPDDPQQVEGAGWLTVNSGSRIWGGGPDCSQGWSVTVSARVHQSAAGCIDNGSMELNGKDCDGKTCQIRITWQGCNHPSYQGQCSE